MAETTKASGDSSHGLDFIVRGLVMIVGLPAFLFFGGHVGSRSPAKLEIRIEAPKS